jgi:hypothetical protein
MVVSGRSAAGRVSALERWKRALAFQQKSAPAAMEALCGWGTERCPEWFGLRLGLDLERSRFCPIAETGRSSKVQHQTTILLVRFPYRAGRRPI